jgi:uncharacterized coiled-coil protein SlyX
MKKGGIAMTGLVEEINKHLAETRQRFDELEHAMIALADVVEQLVEKSAKEKKNDQQGND